MGTPYYNAISPDYFRVAGTRIVAGRGFTDADNAFAPPVAIVSRAMARLVWGTRDPIGECVMLTDPNAPCTRVIGVAQDARRSRILEDTVLSIYLPEAQNNLANVSRAFLVRSTGTNVSVQAVRATVQAAFPRVPFVNVQRYAALIAPQFVAWRLGAEVFVTMAGLALCIAVFGYYSVLAAWVASRTREIAIHAALGASRRQIGWLVFRQTIPPVVAGVCVGALLALGSGRLIAAQLYGTSSADAATFVLSVLVLGAVGAVACLVPLRRALRVETRDALAA